MTNFRNDYSNIPNDMHGLIVKIYISQSTSINKFIHKIFLLYEWTGKMLICLEDKCTRLIIRYRKLQLSNLIISLNLNLATKLTVCTAKHVRRSFDIVLMSLDAPVFKSMWIRLPIAIYDRKCGRKLYLYQNCVPWKV